MDIKSLEGISLPSIAAAFNLAFSDYNITVQYSEEDFKNKLISENIDLKFSPGAFINGELAGFILTGLDDVNGQGHVFNAGTGVIPAYRGKRIVEQLYDYILPVLAAQGYRHHQLEVLEGNDKAEKIYARKGFVRSRKVIAYKGVIGKAYPNNVVIREVAALDWAAAQAFWNVQPTWQNGTGCIRRVLHRHKLLEATVNNEFAGYAVTDTVTGRLKQFAVKKDYRRKGIGTALFCAAADKSGSVSFTNFDECDTESAAFFKFLNLTPVVELYEMTFVHP